MAEPAEWLERLGQAAPWEQQFACIMVGKMRVGQRHGGNFTIHVEFTRGELRACSVMLKDHYPAKV